MPTKDLRQSVFDRSQNTSKSSFDQRKLKKLKVRYLTDLQKAKILGVPVAKLKTAIVLTPKAPVSGESYLTIFSTMMVYPTWPADTGEALFSSGYPSAVGQGAQAEFQRIKTGKSHLVEFNVQLNSNVTYKFRVFKYPLGDFQDIQIVGPKTETIVALIQPIDEITGDLELGAAIQQRNTIAENAGWALFSVRITTTS
jgi:hypothetical protein